MVMLSPWARSYGSDWVLFTRPGCLEGLEIQALLLDQTVRVVWHVSEADQAEFLSLGYSYPRLLWRGQVVTDLSDIRALRVQQ